MKHYNELQAGIFVTLGVFLFIVIVWLLGQESQIFVRQEHYTATFKDVQGLTEGAPIRLGGIAVGRVDKIGFSNNITDPLIYVDLLISSKYLERIRTDSIVNIETQGLLGDKFINIKYDGQGNLLEPGSTLRSAEPADIASVLNKAGQVVANTAEISQSLNNLVGDLRKETFQNIKDAAKDFSDILKAIKDGEGLLHSLVYENKSGSTLVTNLETAVESLSSILNEVKSGEGLLHNIVYEKSNGGVDGLVNKMNNALTNLEKATKALSTGNGTLGALLVDAQLYNNMVEITDGAKRSYILKKVIQSAVDK